MIQSKFRPNLQRGSGLPIAGGTLTLTYIDCAGESVLSRTIYQGGCLVPFQWRIKLAVWSLKREYFTLSHLRGTMS